MESSEDRHSLQPIGSVVDMLQREYPEVSHSSLRFLEREGLIVPTRTRGGHRLFSPSDIERVRRIKEWQAQRLSLDEIRQRLAALDSLEPPGELSKRFLELALAGDVSAARRTILDASDSGLSLTALFAEVLRPALRELGRRWSTGEVSVAQEKEVSEIARDLIAELTQRHSRDGEDGRHGIVAACVAGEQHELGLRMLGGLIRSSHVAVHYLGSSVDPGFLVDSVRLREPRVVLLSATLDENLPAIKAAHEALHEAGVDARVIAGGQAVMRNADTVAGWGIEVADEDLIALVATILEATGGSGQDVRPMTA